MNLVIKIFALILILFLLSQFPGIIKMAVLLVQTVGGFTIALIKASPIFFAVGFLILYGITRKKT